jgi:hypothetical protein
MGKWKLILDDYIKVDIVIHFPRINPVMYRTSRTETIEQIRSWAMYFNDLDQPIMEGQFTLTDIFFN